MSIEFLRAVGVLPGQDEAPANEPTPDSFDKLFDEAALAGELSGRPGAGFTRVESLRAETSVLDASVAEHYRKIAAKAEGEKKTPPAASSDELRKRFGGSEKTVFRKFFAEQRQLGKSVSEILDRFTPEARAEFRQILQELCEEFAAAA
jgi:hypothetical protein